MNCISPDKRSRIEIIRDHYAPKFGSDRLNHEILDWESMEAQHSRFAVLSEYVPLSGKILEAAEFLLQYKQGLDSG